MRRVILLVLVVLLLPRTLIAQTVYANGVVAADHPLASEAGLEMLRQGGNAVDAAVATSFCLSVVRPYSCGIGGGGFMVIHLKDDPRHGTKTIALDYRERAPAAVGPDHFEDLPSDASRYSGHAVGVPGTVAGLLHALEKYGTLDRETVLGPAIRAAQEGFLVDEDLYDAIETLGEHLDDRRPSHMMTDLGDMMLRDVYGPGSIVIGDRIVNAPHAMALKGIANFGADCFYDGLFSAAIVNTVQASGGTMTRDDLRSYTVTEREALTAKRFGHQFITMPLPSSGGITILQILGFMENFETQLLTMEHNDPAYVHLVVEGMKHAFADRAAWLGDTDVVDVPVEELLDDEMLRARAEMFDPGITREPTFYGSHAQLPTDGGTSHLSVVDAHGNAVACTETINLTFGSRLAVATLGFCLNNELDDFLTRRGVANEFGLVQSERNLPAPGKRPLSSMSPTIVLDDEGNVQFVAGGSGGPRIISGTLQVILNGMLFHAGAESAVEAPRFHHQWSPNVIRVEPDLTSPDSRNGPALIMELRGRGHRLETYKNGIGVVQFIRRVEGGWEAASDSRKGGRPAGY